MPCNQETALRSRNYLFSVPALAPPLSIIWWFQLKHKKFLFSLHTSGYKKCSLSSLPVRIQRSDSFFFSFRLFFGNRIIWKNDMEKIRTHLPQIRRWKVPRIQKISFLKKSIQLPKDRVWNRIQSWILLKLSKWGSAVWIPLIAD